jgi:hypothetical protein
MSPPHHSRSTEKDFYQRFTTRTSPCSSSSRHSKSCLLELSSSGSTRTRTRICLYICIFLVAFTAFLSFVGDYAMFTDRELHIKLSTSPSTQKLCTETKFMSYPQCNRVDAVVLIMLGRLYAQTTVADTTMKNLHDYLFPYFSNIPVFVLTNQPYCFTDNTLYIHPKVHVLSIDVQSGGPEFMEPMHHKAVKTRVFQYLPEKNPLTGDRLNRVLYIDSDIQLTRLFPSWLLNLPNIHPSLESASASASASASDSDSKMNMPISKFKSKQAFKKKLLGASTSTSGGVDMECSIGMMPERYYVKNAWQSGIMYLDRQKSSTCLKAWDAKIESGLYHFDQDAYDATPECDKHCAIGKVTDVLYTRDLREILVEIFALILPYARHGDTHASYTDSGAPFIHYTGSAHRVEYPCRNYRTWLTSSCAIFLLTGGRAFKAGKVYERSCALKSKGDRSTHRHLTSRSLRGGDRRRADEP